MKKLILTGFVALFFLIQLDAQQTLIYTHPDEVFEQGKELYTQKKYAASYRKFEDFLKIADKTQAGQLQEAEYYIAANAYELHQKNAQTLLKNYLKNYPYTPFFDRTNVMLGMIEFEKKNYTEAVRYYRIVKPLRLGKYERVDFFFSEGYALLETRDYKQARDIFKTLKNMNTRKNLSATYYYAYSEYSLGNYSVALPEFLKIEDNPEYTNIVPYYVIQIYYAQKEYDKVYDRAEKLLKNNPDNKNNAEIYRILGEISYQNKDFTKAVGYLKSYESLNPQILRNDAYLLGLSYYNIKDYANAAVYLQKITTSKDEMTENAYLHLGNSYIKLGDKNNAKMAYEAALQTKFNSTVREEALFNYALTTYETTTAFGESVKAFEQYINEYSNSKYTDKAYDYLVTAYMTSKNYEAAYQSIQKITRPTPAVLEAKQYILYQLGTQSFMQNNWNKAIEYFSLSLGSSITGKYSAECFFWRSESYYRLNNALKSIEDLKSFFNNTNSKNSSNRKIANYSMAYAYFSQKNYTEAQNWFQKYVDSETNTNVTQYADALNRLGDCFFAARNFAKAETYYTKATQVNPNTGDYGLFQSAYVVGLQKNYTSKISKLEQLINVYPKSEYVDDALYEMGRAYLMLNNDAKAISTYQKLLNTNPNSSVARKAALEIGMIYFNDNNYDQAIIAFKNVVTVYPGSEESYTALESLESVYIEKNDVASYLAYTKTLKMTLPNTSATREDSISYIAAEKQYMNSNFTQAINGLKSYLSSYCPSGRYCIIAQYYLADSYYRSNDKAGALDAYKALLSVSGNQYTQEATTRCAEITYDQKDYVSSLQYFKQLEYLAQNTDQKNTSRLGVLRCSYFLNDHQTTISVANEILNDLKSTDQLKSEARYNRAKAYIALAQSADAVADLKILAADTRTANGAEAKYLLANVYFEQNKLTDSEAEIMAFAKMNTPYQFWLARSFVLLADIYVKKGDDFQAKQYLLSLQKNYTVQDEIQTLINDRLMAISSRENQTIVQ
jgi:tetratricopeptide (TPR) repeat protein